MTCERLLSDTFRYLSASPRAGVVSPPAGVVMLPPANSRVARTQRRTSTIDYRNLKRSSSGSAIDGPTPLIAAGITTGLLQGCKGEVDLNSGGRATWYVPSASLDIASADHLEQRPAELAAARAMGPAEGVSGRGC